MGADKTIIGAVLRAVLPSVRVNPRPRVFKAVTGHARGRQFDYECVWVCVLSSMDHHSESVQYVAEFPPPPKAYYMLTARVRVNENAQAFKGRGYGQYTEFPCRSVEKIRVHVF